MINEPGRGKHKTDASVSFYNVEQNMINPLSSFQIHDNSGYISLSNDDKILAIGVLKEDTINIYEVDNGDLLINVRGGCKTGFWGCMKFLSNTTNSNNSFMEIRAISMDKGRPKDSLLRRWDLGFRESTCYGEHKEGDKIDKEEKSDEEDEEEKKLWEVKRKGAIHFNACEDNIIVCTSEGSQKIEWLDGSSGTIRRTVNTGKWTSKAVVSKSLKFVAVAHFGHCAIYDVARGEVLAEVCVPDKRVHYPVVPVRFIENDKWLLLRVNQERCVMLCDWRHSSSQLVVIKSVGGTISDNCVSVSHDESLLACWPYGRVELYDFAAMKRVLYRKIARLVRWQIIFIRWLVERNRAQFRVERNGRDKSSEVASANGSELLKAIMQRLMTANNIHLVYLVLEFI